MISLQRLTRSTTIGRGLYGKRAIWSNSISFSSPEADFTSQLQNTFSQVQQQPQTNQKVESDKNKWSGLLSYSTPESDFTANEMYYNEHEESKTEITRADFINHIQNNEYHRDTMAYSLSFAGTESDFCSPNVMELLDERMKRQLENVTERAQSRNKDLKVDSLKDTVTENHEAGVMSVTSDTPLPLTYAAATKPDDPRAVVVTEASNPFRIVSVNSAWEDLCGFSAAECHGKTLACLQGPETDHEAINALMTQLKRGEEAETILTNYAKSGRKFRNHLRVGPLMSDHKVTHHVGVLTELVESLHQAGNNGQKINA